MKTDRPEPFRPKRQTISRTGTALAILLGMTAVGNLSYSATTTYQYDALGRLVTVTQGTAATTYTLDPAGNRATKQVSSVTPTPIAYQPTGTSSGTVLEHKGSVVLTATAGTGSTTGTVTFYDGATVIGTVNVVNGVATLTVSGLLAGPHAITVAYSGDGGSTAPNSVTLQIKILNIDWLPAVMQLLLH